MYPTNGIPDPIHQPNDIKLYDESSPYTFEWGKKGFQVENASQMTHRLFRVIKKAAAYKSDVMMTTHCDLVYQAGAYPAYLKEEGNRSDVIYHDPARPHPDKKDFPWLGMDKIFRQEQETNTIKNVCCVPYYCGTFTLKFDPRKTGDYYPMSEEKVHYFKPGGKPDKHRIIDYGYDYDKSGEQTVVPTSRNTGKYDNELYG